MDQPTIAIYDNVAQAWRTRRKTQRVTVAKRFATGLRKLARERDQAATIVDLGCGPGGHLGSLGRSAIGLDASLAMLRLAADANPTNAMVCADLEHLPFRTGSIDGAWASKSYVHLPRVAVPAALRECHRALRTGGSLCAVLFGGDTEFGPAPNDDFPGRNFSTWPVDLLRAVFVGAGFAIVSEELSSAAAKSAPGLTIEAEAIRTCPDVIGPGMTLLACGINPSPASADDRVGYARPGNRFWPAALAAGAATVDRDPPHALTHHGMGMTDLVKRTTRKASEVTADEFEAGLARLELIASWLQPKVICFVGLSGYRSARDRKAVAGPLPERIGGSPAYLMPSTSGLNAHTKPADFARHFKAALKLAEDSQP